MREYYTNFDDEDFAEAAEASLESQNPHAPPRVKPTDSDDKLE